MRADVGAQTTDDAHNGDEPGPKRKQEIAEAEAEDARKRARERLSKLNWLQEFLAARRKHRE